MAYQALYRKWRPRTFDSVVGQEAITDTLKNAIIRNKVSHAFLFTGPRGTGKTSCAKIFAKALNCLNLQDGEPCNECENCKAADSGAMPDIIEIDAASNNGVDEIREIRDKVKYAPTQGKYKVYIIDEVHMLSIGAFNALLKTLEEPPEHVVFILATTELQKVPATIISRTQRYNFKRISKQNLVDRMKFILEQENIPYEDSALQVIAQVADGGMRDSLSILDQLLSFEKEKVEYKDALNITGYAARETTEQLFLNLLNQKVSESLDLSHKLLQDGATAKNLLSELISLATETMLVLKANKDSEFLTKDFTNQITTVPEKRYFQLITAANEALNDLRFTNQEEIPLDVFLVKVANPIEESGEEKADSHNAEINPAINQELSDLKAQVVALAKKVSQTNGFASSNQVFKIDDAKKKNESPKASEPQAKPKPKRKKPVNSELNRQAVYAVLEKATKKDLEDVRNVWPDLQSVLGVSEQALLKVLEPVAASHNRVVMKCKYAFWFERTSENTNLMATLNSELAKFLKHDSEIVLVPDADWLQVRKDFLAKHKDEILARQKQGNAEIEVDQHQEDDQEKQVIDKAKEIFGSDNINVKD